MRLLPVPRNLATLDGRKSIAKRDGADIALKCKPKHVICSSNPDRFACIARCR